MLKTCLKTLLVAVLFGFVSSVEIRNFTFKSIWGTLLKEGKGIVSWRILTAVLDDSVRQTLTCLTRKWETGAQMKEENLQRGPEKWRPQPYFSFALSLISPVIHTMSLSLSWLVTRGHQMMHHTEHWSFLLEVIGLVTKGELLVFCCHHLWLLGAQLYFRA